MPHDTDRTQLEFGSEISEYAEMPELASEQYEYPGELGSIIKSMFGESSIGESFESGYQEFQEFPLSEAMHDELASELLEVRSDQELDHFLGSLFSKVASGIGKVMKSPIGQALGGVLKQVAKQALPMVGQAIGQSFGPGGAAIGSQLASAAGSAFGLEYGGMSSEDRDFEAARRYVRFASDAARRASYARPDIEPKKVVSKALVEAARVHAPGLVSPRFSGDATGAARAFAAQPPSEKPVYSEPRPRPPIAPGYSPIEFGTYPVQPPCPSCGGAAVGHRRTGKWIRRGRHIILLGV